MAWTIEYLDAAIKQLSKLDKATVRRIDDYLCKIENPRFCGKALKGKLKGYWRYRIGNFRAVCDIQDEKLIILVIEIGDRKDIYK